MSQCWIALTTPQQKEFKQTAKQQSKKVTLQVYRHKVDRWGNTCIQFWCLAAPGFSFKQSGAEMSRIGTPYATNVASTFIVQFAPTMYMSQNTPALSMEPATTWSTKIATRPTKSDDWIWLDDMIPHLVFGVSSEFSNIKYDNKQQGWQGWW